MEVVVDNSNDSSEANASTSDNSSICNRSSSSVYSAEEQIIQQRGPRSPNKKSHHIDLQQHFDIFHLENLSQSQRNQLHQRFNSPRQKKKSLLRTPVKKRLKRHASFLSKLRKSDKRRK